MLSKDIVVKLIENNTNVYLVDLNSRSISLGIIKRIVPSKGRKETSIWFYFEYCVTEKKGVQYKTIDSMDESFILCETREGAINTLFLKVKKDVEAKVMFINKMLQEVNGYGEEIGKLFLLLPIPETTLCSIWD